MKLEDDVEGWDQEDWDQEDWKQDDGKDMEAGEDKEGRAVRPLSAVLVCVGLVASAAIICAILWNVTHRSDPGRNNPDGSDSNQDFVAEQTGESETAPVQDAETISEEDSGSAPETVPEGYLEPDPGETSGEEGEQGPDPTSEPTDTSGEESEASASAGLDSSAGVLNAGEVTMVFSECQDTVTPKEAVNLRSAPSTAQEDTIVARAVNGEQLERTGINGDTGWSRVEYNGQTLYAVSRYLTTDLTYQPTAGEPDPNIVSTKSGRTITFTDCDDNISPKEYVNLRLEPSTSEGNDTVHCRLEYGEVVHRTGISEESGWSRVEYDGIVLYVVTSYMYVVEVQ